MRAELVHAAARWRLAVPRRRLAGRLGDRVGRGVGSSIEFEDHRPYQPGDDPRHVDWRAYARTDRLEVRLYREEVAPTIDVVVDLSASMRSTARKLAALQDLVDAVRCFAGREGGALRIYGAGGGVRDVALPLAPDGASQELAPQAPLRANGLRVVVSDFLVPADPLAPLARIAAGGAHTFVVQLLDPDEIEPPAGGTVTLVDVETGAQLDLALDAAAIGAYRARLDRQCAAVADAARRTGATFARIAAGPPPAMFEALAQQGAVVPA